MTLFARLRRFAWPPPPATPFAAGVAALDAGRVDESLAHFAAAAAAASSARERAEIANKCGVAHVRRGELDDAVAAFVQALQHEPNFVPAIVNVGNLLLESGDVEEAVVHYQAALVLDDGYAAAHLNLGIAYKRLGRRADAVRAFRRAARRDARGPLRAFGIAR